MQDERTKGGFKQAVRKLLPETILREREIISRLGPRAGTIYARLKLLESIGVRSSQRGRLLPTNPHSVLFLCFGNIMRSPMAEALFRKAAREAHLTDVESFSAGLHAIPGREAHSWALTAAAEMGVPLTDHRACLLTAQLVDRADVVLVMDFQNKAEFFASYPTAKDKVLLLSDFSDVPMRGREIPDPYFGNLDTTRSCYAMLQTCIHNLIGTLVTLRTTPLAAKASSGASRG